MKKQIALVAVMVIAAAGAGLAIAQGTITGGTAISTPGATATPGAHHHHHHKKAEPTPTVVPIN